MATYYIDPSAPTNGNGTSTATPYNTWVGVTLTANNIYLQKRGTTYVGASVRPQSQTSARATPLTIGAYYYADGTDEPSALKPVIDHNGGTNGVGAVFVDTCTNVLVTNIHGKNSLAADGAGVRIRRSVGVTVDGCECSVANYGIILAQDQAAVTSTTTDIILKNNIVYNNLGAGISWRWGDVATAVFKRVTIKSNIVRNNGTALGGSGTLRCGGIVHYANYVTDTNASYRNQDFTIEDNIVDGNNGYGIALYMTEAATRGVFVSGNTVNGSGKSLSFDSHSLWVGSCFNFVVNDNVVVSNYALANFSSGSGVGIFIDYTSASSTGGSYGTIVRNYVDNQYKGATLAVAPSAGIHVITNDHLIIASNVVNFCRNGIVVSSGTSDDVLITQNTITNITENGIVANANATNVTVSKNIVVGASTGIFRATANTAGFVENYNCVANCTYPINNGTLTSQTPTSLDVSDTTTNPMLVKFIPTVATVGPAGSYIIPRNKGNHAFPANLGAMANHTARGAR